MDVATKQFWMPITKEHSTGDFVGILSDTSLDRDGEMMSKELLQSWAENGVLPALANHANKMESFVGGWKEMKTIEKNGHIALIAKPFFFSKEANPLASQIQKQISEAVENGLNPGISIGAIPREHKMEKMNDKEVKVYTKAELLEATFVPIQSNRNANFGHIAKDFDIELTKPKEMDDCVKHLMADPNFKPKEGRSKEESAYAVCQSRMKEHREVSKMEDATTITSTVNMMTNSPITLKDQFSETRYDELEDLKKQISELKAELKSYKEHAVLPQSLVEGPVQVQKQVPEANIQNLLKLTHGIPIQ